MLLLGQVVKDDAQDKNWPNANKELGLKKGILIEVTQ
jgi:hypothetical protein